MHVLRWEELAQASNLALFRVVGQEASLVEQTRREGDERVLRSPRVLPIWRSL